MGYAPAGGDGDQAIQGPLAWIPRAAAMAVMSIAGIALAGWILRWPALTRILPTWPAIVPNTALALAASAAALWLSLPGRSRRARSAGIVLAALVAAFGLLVISESALGLDSGLDRVLFRDAVGALGTSHPGRPAPLTASALTFGGAALALLDTERRRGYWPGRVLGGLSALVSVAAVFGYIFRVDFAVAITGTTGIAVPTAIALLLFNLGLLTARPERGLVARLPRRDAGGALVRWLLPVALTVPLALAVLIEVGRRYGWYDTNAQLALIAVATMLALLVALTVTLQSVEKIDAARRSALRRQAMLAAATQAVLRAQDEDTLLRETCRIATTLGGYPLAWVGTAIQEGKSVVPVAQAGFEDGYLDRAHITWDETPRGQGPSGRAVRTRRAQLTIDIQHDPTMTPWLDDATARGYLSAVALPLVVDEQVLVLHIYADRPDAFDEAELALLHQWTDNLTIGVSALRAGRERRRAEQALRASERRYRTTVEHNAAGVARVALDGAFLSANPRFCQITGFTERELRGLTWPSIARHNDPAADLTQRDRLVTGQIPWYSMDTRFARKDATSVWVSLNVAALRDQDGAVREFVATVVDISEQQLARAEVDRLNTELEDRVRARTAELTASNEQLRVANRELEDFTYTVSHDLRAPLRHISGFSHLVLQEHGDRLDDEGKRRLTVVTASAQRLGGLIDDLLAFSRIGRHSPARRPVDMNGLAHTVADELRTGESDRDIAVRIEDLPVAYGDAALLTQVWTNLLSNAIKFTATREHAEISVTGAVEDGQAVYRVKDNGVGFDMDYSDQVFGVFQRLHTRDGYPGSGVGLAIVARIIARHGGSVAAEAVPGEGATFSFTLPATEDGTP